MRLLKFKLVGVKRFAEQSSLLVADQLVAIVGPNEAGKSTLLLALSLTGSGEPLPPELGTRTRPASAVPATKALFQLEQSDTEALAHVPMINTVERCWVEKSRRRSEHWTFEPEPARDLAPRRVALEAVEDLTGDEYLDAAYSTGELAWSAETWEAAREILASDDETLPDNAIATITEAGLMLESIEAPPLAAGEDDEADAVVAAAWEASSAARSQAAQALDQAATAESKEHPRSMVEEVLGQRLPRFALFSQEERDIQDRYDLAEFEDGQFPAPLANLAQMAGLSLPTLIGAIEGDRGYVEQLIEVANERLDQVFSESWDQSLAAPRLALDGTVMSVLVQAGKELGYLSVSDRSDGLRWFLALRAFLEREGARDTILLIDEIETHLHLGAQANLIEILENQRLAKQVIYTTHSPGALPPDLGTGVRAVEPSGEHRSVINNAFWTSGPGHAPLLFGMGASALPFAVPREILITEGASDAILYPTLIREATGSGPLVYRVAPGISNASTDSLGDLDKEGGRVAYIVDGDPPGLALAVALEDAGIDGERIHSLAHLASGGVTLEDLVTAEVYVEAVQIELRPYLADDLPQVSDLSEAGRAAVVKAWCKARDVDPPSKIRVAQNIVSAATQTFPPTHVLNALGQKALVELHKRLADQLGFDAEVTDPSTT
ncbi:MAG: hypothetical protein JWO77_1285 [Ilumatobacteraceae bacterium]|nr:hypothetical protein [Ilumatobacteraceae bacterium]